MPFNLKAAILGDAGLPALAGLRLELYFRFRVQFRAQGTRVVESCQLRVEAKFWEPRRLRPKRYRAPEECCLRLAGGTSSPPKFVRALSQPPELSTFLRLRPQNKRVSSPCTA